MIIIWRGWGILALFVLFVPLVTFGGVHDFNQWLALPVAGLALGGCGGGCWVYGRKWNQPLTQHSLYFIPLEYWGILFMLVGALLSLGGFTGYFRVR